MSSSEVFLCAFVDLYVSLIKVSKMERKGLFVVTFVQQLYECFACKLTIKIIQEGYVIVSDFETSEELYYLKLSSIVWQSSESDDILPARVLERLGTSSSDIGTPLLVVLPLSNDRLLNATDDLELRIQYLGVNEPMAVFDEFVYDSDHALAFEMA